MSAQDPQQLRLAAALSCDGSSENDAPTGERLARGMLATAGLQALVEICRRVHEENSFTALPGDVGRLREFQK